MQLVQRVGCLHVDWGYNTDNIHRGQKIYSTYDWLLIEMASKYPAIPRRVLAIARYFEFQLYVTLGRRYPEFDCLCYTYEALF